MKQFSVYLRPEDPSSGLQEYATCIEARAAWLAKSQAMAMLEELVPDTAHLYAEPCACEDGIGQPRPPVNVLCTDFLKTYRWDDELQAFVAREPVASEPVNFDALSSEQKMAVLVRHGTADINSDQLRDAQLLLTEQRDSLEGHIVESLLRTKSLAAMYPAVLLELIAELGNNFDAADNWTQMKAFNEKWLKDRQAARKEDKEPSKKEPLRTPSGALAGGGIKTDRSPDLNHNFETLGIEIAAALVEPQFDIYEIPFSVVQRAKEMIGRKDENWSAWHRMLCSTPGVLDASRAEIIACIRTAPDDVYTTPGAMQAHIVRSLVETDHEHPAAEIIEIACGRRPAANGEEQNNEAQQEQARAEHVLADAAQPAGAVAADSGQQDGAAPGVAEQPPVTERPGPFYVRNDAGEVKRANKQKALTQLLAQGYIEISKDEFQRLKNSTTSGTTGTSGDKPEPSPASEGQNALDINNAEIVQIEPGVFGIDALLKVDAAGAPPSDHPEVLPAKPSAPEQQVINVLQPVTLTYEQQLTIAALQGLCANPVHSNAFDDLPAMAADLAAGVIRQQDMANAALYPFKTDC